MLVTTTLELSLKQIKLVKLQSQLQGIITFKVI